MSDWQSSSRERPSWDDYFLDIVRSVSSRATCNRGRCGAVLALDRQILATGYVGSPPGFPHCDDVGHELINGHCVRTVHAEQNAITSAARRGIPTVGSTCYTKVAPCRVCAMLLVTAGVTRVVALSMYQDQAGLHVLQQARVPYTVISKKVLYVP
jgi:dCMP deaminase